MQAADGEPARQRHLGQTLEGVRCSDAAHVRRPREHPHRGEKPEAARDEHDGPLLHRVLARQQREREHLGKTRRQATTEQQQEYCFERGHVEECRAPGPRGDQQHGESNIQRELDGAERCYAQPDVDALGHALHVRLREPGQQRGKRESREAEAEGERADGAGAQDACDQDGGR